MSVAMEQFSTKQQLQQQYFQEPGLANTERKREIERDRGRKSSDLKRMRLRMTEKENA